MKRITITLNESELRAIKYLKERWKTENTSRTIRKVIYESTKQEYEKEALEEK